MVDFQSPLALSPASSHWLSCAQLSDSRRATEFTWNGLVWDSHPETSIVYDKVGADTVYANVYENIVAGPSVGDTEPGTCDSGDFRGLFWWDTAGSDSGLKWCNNEDGSYNWDRPDAGPRPMRSR